MSRKIPYSEVQRHRSRESCWVILYGIVWDVTGIVSTHPGGSDVIIEHAGTDATEVKTSTHPKSK